MLVKKETTHFTEYNELCQFYTSILSTFKARNTYVIGSVYDNKIASSKRKLGCAPAMLLL